MASPLDFPSGQPTGTIHTDGLGQRWQYDATVNSWSVLGGPVGFTGDVVVDGKTLSFVEGALKNVA